ETRLVGAGSHALVNLRREDILVAGDPEIAQGLARHHLRPARMVDIGGIYKVDAVIEGRPDEVVYGRLLQLADTAPQAVAGTEGHGTEAQLGNEQAGIAEFLQSHREMLRVVARGQQQTHLT